MEREFIKQEDDDVDNGGAYESSSSVDKRNITDYQMYMEKEDQDEIPMFKIKFASAEHGEGIQSQVNYSPNSIVSPYERYISPEVILEVKDDDHIGKLGGGAPSSSGYHCGAESLVSSMSSKEPPKKKPRTYRYSFHEEWEEQYFFTNLNGKCLCLICHSSVSVGKKCNVERHFTTVHKNFESEYPSKSDLRKAKVKELKAALWQKQALYIFSGCKSKAATIASFKVAHLLALKKRPFEDGEFIKSTIITASESLFHAYKNKTEILSAIRDVQLSESIIAERIQVMSDNIHSQLKDDIELCDFLSLQCVEAIGASYKAQLNVFVRMAFKDCTSKEDLLAVIPLKEELQGRDIYQAFKSYMKQINFPLEKLVSITTDGALSMTDNNVGFVSLCKKDADFPNFLSYHCVIHQHVLCTKIINFEHVINVVLNVVNSLHYTPLHSKLFKMLLDEYEENYSMLMLHSDVWLLERGKVLLEFQELLPEIIESLESKDEHYEELSDPQWLLDLAFLADISSKLYNLNLELQSKGKILSQMIGYVNAFKSKLNLWISQIRKNVFSHFPCLEKRVQNMAGFENDIYCRHLEEIKKNFEVRFADFRGIQPTATFLLNPFIDTDISEMSVQIANVIKRKVADIEIEIISFQSNLQLKARSSEKDFWNMVEKDKYPFLKETYLRMNACFGSTYLCENGFSSLELLKCRCGLSMTDIQIQNCLRLSISPYVPEFEKLVENMLGKT